MPVIRFVTQVHEMPESAVAMELFGGADDPADLGYTLDCIRGVAKSYVEENGEDESLTRWVEAAEALWKKMGWRDDAEADALVPAYY